MAHIAKAIAGFIVPYVLILVSPIGISSTTSFEEALTVILTSIFVGLSSFAGVYFTSNKVKEGQAIATMGNTGFVVSGNTPFWKNNPYAGTHLHLGLRYVKRPKTGGWTYPGSKVRLSVVNANNGYKGAVDPIPELWGVKEIVEADVWKQTAMTVISLANTVLSLLKLKKKHTYLY